MAKRKREYDDDDGRVIANMNVEGMPWYRPDNLKKKEDSSSEPVKLTREEKRAYRAGAMKAGLVLCLIFSVAYGLFILFCDLIWFR